VSSKLDAVITLVFAGVVDADVPTTMPVATSALPVNISMPVLIAISVRARILMSAYLPSNVHRLLRAPTSLIFP
jgi:hypothetical protein